MHIVVSRITHKLPTYITGSLAEANNSPVWATIRRQC